jgi:putative tributyrin esterase
MHFLLLAALILHIPAQSGTAKPPSVRTAPELTRPAAAAERLREETVNSAALGRAMKYRVLLPDGYQASLRRYPVLYLLHGLGGNYQDWTGRSNLAEYTRTLPLIVVMPDGENGWYTNAADGSAKFEDYLFTELPADVVQKFRTINSRYGRAIAGLSMGGYGALKTALKRPGAFAVVGAFSGAFEVTRQGRLERLIGAAESERIARIFGPPDSQTRKDNDVFTLAAAMKPPAAPYIYIDCGIADNELIAANREVVAALHKAGVAYEYHEVAGGHTWDYWDRQIRAFLPVLMKRMTNE